MEHRLMQPASREQGSILQKLHFDRKLLGQIPKKTDKCVADNFGLNS
jgi:hypothetical protein